MNWRIIAMYLFVTALAVVLAYCIPARADPIPLTVTLSTTGQLAYSFPCTSTVTAGRRGDDTVVVRCGGVERLTIAAASVNCRNLKVAQAANTATVRCS